MELHDLTLIEARDAMADRRLGAEQYTRALLDRVAAHDGGANGIGSFLSVFGDEAIDRAREIDRRTGRGEYVGPLAGVVLALKDNICLNRGLTTCASRMLEKYESPYSATAAARLEHAGAIILGKTNCDEFAMGSSTENSALGVTRNPWDISRVPGGSSGGSAAAVAARFVPGALGSDTGGSVRQPAAFCGVVGLKPSYGMVSRWGLVAYASSLDQIGPITRTVADAALLMEVIGGHDPLDSTSSMRGAPSLVAGIEDGVEPLRLGVPRECRSEKNDPGVRETFENAVETYRALGAEIVDVELPHLSVGISAYYLIATAEASSNLARFDGIRYGHRAEVSGDSGSMLFDLYARSRAEGFGAEVQRRIMLGTYALSAGYYDAYYLTALKARRLIRQDLDRAFEHVHAILMPTTPGPAFRLGEKQDDPLALYLEDIYTVTINLAGVPAISMPAGFTSIKGVELPLGVQIVAPTFEESRLLRIARQFERVTVFGKRSPHL